MSFAQAQDRSDGVRDLDAALRELKRQGCALLITGEVPEHVTAKATKRLLGDPNCGRKRLLAFTDATSEHIDDCLPSGVKRNAPDVWIIDPCGIDRAIPSTADDIELPKADEGSELNRLRQELVQAVGYFDDVAEGLDPAELRVSIDSLEYMLEANDLSPTERFLRTVAALVRGVRGMGHVHLPLPDDSATVQELSPLFDARIELRKRDTLAAEQRWHVPRHDITTIWTKL
ncbi:DUF7504 family protein [Haladaptatus halobius]|uniref:DUF7504 family protein n=1 Tax=Haladaptatus halobius TaxID=2884875 RepID=UPI001D0B3AB2|nr:hypothetical protein [Haladaptatus halobius]